MNSSPSNMVSSPCQTTSGPWRIRGRARPRAAHIEPLSLVPASRLCPVSSRANGDRHLRGQVYFPPKGRRDRSATESKRKASTSAPLGKAPAGLSRRLTGRTRKSKARRRPAFQFTGIAFVASEGTSQTANASGSAHSAATSFKATSSDCA